MTRLHQHWKAILTSFFPRWRAASGWRCTTRTCRTGHGYCDVERRVIEIGVVSEDDDALDLLLIHESAHAVAPGSHGKTWQRRMALAADTARKLGRLRLAELLETEIANYRDQAEPLAVAYGEVENALLGNPDLTLAQIKRWLAQVYGLKFSEIAKVYRGLGTVYKKAQKEALELRQARPQWATQA
jgi:hypothetical protein